MKKLVSVILALMLILSLTVPAFAAEGDPVITVPDDGHTYEVYQIFTADLLEQDGDITLTNVKWGKNGTGTEGEEVDQAILDELHAISNSKDNEANLDVITKYVVTTAEPIATLGKAEEGQEKVLSATVTPGYYLIKDKDGSVTGHESYTTYIVEVVDSLTITRKAGVPKVEKKIVEGFNRVTENEASIGDTITYEFTGTLPTNIADYSTYFYKFLDTMVAGLTITDTNAEVEGIQTDVTVMVDDVDLTKYFYINATENADGTTSLIVGIEDLLALENAAEFTDKEITETSTVVVTYTAVLNKNAVVGTNGNKNEVYLEFDNNPNDNGEGGTTPPPEYPDDEPKSTKPTGTTPKSEVWTYTTEIIIEKVDQNGNILTGAAFTITGEGVNIVVTTGEVFVPYAAGEEITVDNCYWRLTDGTYTTQDPNGKIMVDGEEVDVNTSVYADTTIKYHKEVTVAISGKTQNVNVEAFVNSEGKVIFTGLGAGTYTITESVVPAGYNGIDPFTVTIEWNAETADKEDCSWDYTWSNDPNKDNEEAKNNTNTTVIKNQAGVELPETGGMGTTLIYAVGGILFVAALVLLVTKKRMSSET